MTSRRALLLGSSLVILVSGAITYWSGGLKKGLGMPSNIHDRPATPARHANWAALLPTDTATIPTGDPAPHDRACRSRSALTMSMGDHWIRPNLHFDFEDSADSSWISRQKAHTGSSCMLIKEGVEYTPPIRRSVMYVADSLQAVNVGLWLLADTTDPSLTIVSTVERKGQQVAWAGKELDTLEHLAGEWQRLNAEFQFSELVLAQDDVISVYLWNRNKQQVYVDDMDIVFRSRRVPGRTTGEAFRIEGPKGGHMPLPFAKVSFVANVDPKSEGVFVGQAAPPISAPEVPLVPGSAHRFRLPAGSAVGHVVDADGVAQALVRAWCPEVGRDLLGYEHMLVSPGDRGLRFIAFDVDIDAASGRRTVAQVPAPIGAELLLTLETP
jgi:hypothetical protein